MVAIILDNFSQGGRKQVAAGYVIYGSSTMFVYTAGDGVHGFTLDPGLGEFVLTNENMKLPEDGKIYSCNQANSLDWSAGVQAYLNYVNAPDDGKKYSLRYVGSLVG